MSGLRTECSCPESHCLQGNCQCFKAKLFCSLRGCSCIGCQNTESNKAEVDSKYKAYLKRNAPDVDDKDLIVPPPRFAGCTSTCTCQDCANPKGIRRSDTKIEGEQVGDNSSMAKEPAQMQEQPAQSVDNSGSSQNK